MDIFNSCRHLGALLPLAPVGPNNSNITLGGLFSSIVISPENHEKTAFFYIIVIMFFGLAKTSLAIEASYSVSKNETFI